MNTKQAAVAYKIALAAVTIFLDERRHLGVRNLMNSPQRLPDVKGGVNLDHFGGAKVDQLVKG